MSKKHILTSARLVAALAIGGWFVALPVAAQFNITPYQTAQKDDWEEINFEYNQSGLTDGFPSLLRLAELLQQNPGYKVKLEGYADQVGPNNYNDALGLRRAESVKAFLVKYGARATQLDAVTHGKRTPKVPDFFSPRALHESPRHDDRHRRRRASRYRPAGSAKPSKPSWTS